MDFSILVFIGLSIFVEDSFGFFVTGAWRGWTLESYRSGISSSVFLKENISLLIINDPD